MGRYTTGDLVWAKLGALPAVGVVVAQNPKTGDILVRFSAVQQDWFPEDALTPWAGG